MPITLNLANVPSDNKIPVDTYDGEIIVAGVDESSNGNQFIELKIRISGGDFDGRQITKRLYTSAAAIGYTRRQLQTILGHALPDEDGLDFDEQELVDYPVRFKVVHKASQDGTSQYSEIAGFMPAVEAVSGTASEKSAVAASKGKRRNANSFLADD